MIISNRKETVTMKRVIVCSTNNTTLSQVLNSLKRLAYSVEELSAEDTAIFEEATGLTVQDILDAHYDLHHQIHKIEMSTDIKVPNTSLQRVCENFSQFVGAAENLSEEDEKEFQEITGFTVVGLLEAYSALMNRVKYL